ncbi:MAG TPA: hypothetical protein VJN64_10865 [Terriglobales bacterium]|nr:hypothetical protein [Terriglobales bacterium]
MSIATLKAGEAAEFWRVARRLHSIYAELDETFELGKPPCLDLENPEDRNEPEVLDRVRQWFEEMDSRIQVWQLRQLLQSTNLQTEENLRYLIKRHLERPQKTEADKEKLDFLLVQYFAHCAPEGITEQHVTLEQVAAVLEPALGAAPAGYPDWVSALDEKLQRMNACNSLEDVQNSGALLEVRELKLAVGDDYFQPALLVAFTRFNFRARRAFFKAMHLDLHAIRSMVNDLEQLGFTSIDCREAGLTENESLDQVRHVVHQWKTPFRAPYSGGASFLQLILLRHILRLTLEQSNASHGSHASPTTTAHAVVDLVEGAESKPERATSNGTGDQAGLPQVPAGEEDSDYLQRCVADITEQLLAVPAKNSPAVSAITLGGCKLLIATWEADAFTHPTSPTALALQRTVAARTILHVCMERERKGEPTDLKLALDLAKTQGTQMQAHVSEAKESKDIDAAVNLAATTKRLMALIDEAEKTKS